MAEDSKKTIQEIIQYLKNEYTFPYYYSKEELKCMNFELSKAAIDFEFLPHPIYFASGENEKVISVMAFGGCIGWILLDDEDSKEQIDSKNREKIMAFAKYLSPKNAEDTCYINEHKHKIFLPKKFVEKSEYSNNGKARMERLLDTETSVNQILYNKEYLDLMVCAAYVRYMHRKLEDKKSCADKNNRKTLMYDTSERSIQTVIARKNLENAKHQNLLVIDIEFKQSYKDGNKKKVTPSVDFVVLDKEKKSFGLIEFKFQGKSMDPKDKNSLTAHFEDFANLIHLRQEKIVKRLVQHTKLLLENKIMEVHDKGEIMGILDEIEKNAKKDVLWCGFYFVDNKQGKVMDEEFHEMEQIKYTSRDKNRMTMNQRINYDCYYQIVQCDDGSQDNKSAENKEQEYIKFGIDLKNVRFQHSDIMDVNFWKLCMDSNFVDANFEKEIQAIKK